ncbi:Tyrosinase, partial [Lachnellula suecica]
MAAINHPVIGAPKPSPAATDGSVPLRIEIRDLQANHPDQWNLYLLALDAFKSVDEKSDLSYYGIAGIHGRPYRPWGGVQGNNPSGWQGYCTHTSILFAPWHRPYLALFEQTLYKTVQEIAEQFPDSSKARYQQAASTFRVPYWDWAAEPASGDYFPNAVASPKISVITPQSNGKTVQINNPLYTYTFKPLNPIGGDFTDLPFRTWPATLRYPSSPRSVKAVSQEDQVAQAMASQFGGLQENVNLLMSDPNYKDFGAFSNHAWQQNEPGTFASIEDIHNSIHVAVGGTMGHMSELDYSAFDPVFWLHHVNVDRLFAIWQALNPASYTINKRAGDGTFVINSNSTETAATPLAPFFDASGTKNWTSETARQTEVFNYAYPETQRWKFGSDAKYQTSVRSAAQQLYGGISNQFMSLAAATPAPTLTAIETAAEDNKTQEPMKTASIVPKQDADGTRGLDLESEVGKSPDLSVPPKESSYTEYIVNLKAPKHILQQKYVVHIFLGPFNRQTNTWATQNALVGNFAVFGKERATTGCGKCKQDADDNVEITGTVPLTGALLKEFQQGTLGGLEKENVLPWLRDNLHWRVTLADGTERSRDEVPGLKVSVVSTE